MPNLLFIARNKLNEKFTNLWIGRRDFVVWSVNSSDLILITGFFK